MASVECFSRLASVRCQGLSETQHIALYLPTGLGILLVPILLALAWREPRATIIFLALDILLGGVVGTWNLLVKLVPPSPESFRSQDLALGVISALPILSALLFANSILISDLRPCLANALKKNTSALVYSCLVVPLIPMAFVGTLLGNILFIVYFKQISRVSTGFERMPLRRLNEVLSVVGIASATAFSIIVLSTFILVYLKNGARARWLLEYPSLPALVLLSLGLGLSSLSLGLGLVHEAFAIIIVRQVIQLASRVALTIGLVGAYYPLRSQEPKKRKSSQIITQPVAGSLLKMDQSATRSFHASPRRSADVPQRVITRHSPHPALSFTPSTFDQSHLSSLADEVRSRERLIQESIAQNDRVTTNPFLSPAEQQDRYRQVKKNIGSIYRPKLVPVEERELAHWPPDIVPGPAIPNILPTTIPATFADFPTPPPRILAVRPALTPTGSLDGVSARLSPGERVGQVAAYRAGDFLHPTPERRPSTRRKPVRTNWDNHSANQSMEGILSFISTSTTPAPPGSPSRNPSAEAAWDDNLRSTIPRRPKRRETDPARAVMTRSVGEDSSVYSQGSTHASDFALFYGSPHSSPLDTSPNQSTSPQNIVHPRVQSLSRRQPPSEVELAMSSLDRIRRDTGVDLGAPGPSHPERDAELNRLSTTTWTSDDVSPRVSERGWWGDHRV